MTVIGIQDQREPGNINNAVDTCIWLPGFGHLGSKAPLIDEGFFIRPKERSVLFNR